MKNVDVFFSFRSPYSYLVTSELLSLKSHYDVTVNLAVVLPVAIRSPDTLFNPQNANRVKYILLDWQRRAQFLGLPHAWPSPDPIVQDMKTMKIAEDQPYIYRLSALGVEAQHRGRGIEFAAEVMKVIWGGTRDWHQGEHLGAAANRAGLDLASMESAIEGGNQLEEVEANQVKLAASNHWGVPTMVFEGEPFFGQDRMETLCWRLDQHGLRKSRDLDAN